MLEADPVSVLIVDDQAPFRAAARTVVAVTAGFEVVAEVDSGEAAITEARAASPGLILMDINLPGINGIDATREILSKAPGTVVILLSTYQARDLPADAVSCGAAAYVHKEDFSPDEVRRIWDARVGP